MILDTSFLLDLMDGDPVAFEKAVDLHETDVPQRVAAPSAMELYYGAAFVDSEDERRRVRNLLLMYPLVDVGEPEARLAAEALARADRQAGGDSGVDNEDGLIGAVAERFDEPVLTADVDHFERLGVSVETY